MKRGLSLSLALLAGLAAIAPSGKALAQGGEIVVAYSGETTLYGSCLPNLQARNGSGGIIQYLQVDLSITLSDGRRRVLELKSRYREGHPNPIAPGEARNLRINLDESVPLGGPCADIIAISVAGVECVGDKGSCPGKVTPSVGDALMRPR